MILRHEESGGIGHMKQLSLEKTNWKHRFCYGGTLRQKRNGRKARPLSTKTMIHLVLKANKERIRGGFRTHQRFQRIHFILRKYAKYFWIRIDQISIQSDHIHVLIRAPRRSKYLDFFRVVAGQIAQRLEKEGLLSAVHASGGIRSQERVTDTPKFSATKTDLHAARRMKSAIRPKKLWRYRPFTRVVNGYRAWKIVQDYIQLNEKEALGEIIYHKERLRGLSLADWNVLWK